jgi:hypothetical protein
MAIVRAAIVDRFQMKSVIVFLKIRRCAPSKHCFDLYVTAPLGPDSVLRIHSEGDSSFHAIGVGYPEGYVDVDLNYWKELTGEEG